MPRGLHKPPDDADWPGPVWPLFAAYGIAVVVIMFVIAVAERIL